MTAGKKPPAGAQLSRKRGKDPVRGRKRQPPQNPHDAEVRMGKVERIKTALERGEYNVPASEVAARILDEMRRK